jgi:hypothetical protein
MKLSHPDPAHSASSPPRRNPDRGPKPRLFDFGFTSRHPLVPMAAVALFLNRTRKEVLALIDAGSLRWAFDIRSKRATAREVRVLRQSLFEYTGLFEPTKTQPGVSAHKELEPILHLILPHGVTLRPGDNLSERPGWRDTPSKKEQRASCVNGVAFAAGAGLESEPVMWGTEVAEALGCTAEHVRKLIHDRSLETVPLRRSPKASAIVKRDSVVCFLQGRRMS